MNPSSEGFFYRGSKLYPAKLQKYFSERQRGRILLLLIAVGVVYLPFLGNPFLFDDLSFFSTSVIETYAEKGFELGLRWLPYASFGWTYEIFSDEFPHIYHLGSMLVHAANTVLLFLFLSHLIGAVQPKSEDSATAVHGAWFGALVFALHPVVVYAVGYAIQISILMATTFALLMQLAYLRGLLGGQKRWFVLAVIAYFLACFSKEHSVLMPAVLGAMGFVVHTDKPADKRVLWLTWLSFFAVALLVTLRARGVMGTPYEPMAAQLFAQQGIEASTPMLHLFSALTQGGLFFKYLLLWVLPDPSLMSIDMRETFVNSLSSVRGWLGGFAFIFYGAFGIRLLLRGGGSGLAGFAMLYPWLLFWVEMVGVRMQEPFVLYRSYLWMPGLMLFFPLLVLKLSERKVMLGMVCLVFLLVPLSWGRLQVLGNDYRLWNEAALLLKNDQVAGADRILYNRGRAEMALQKWESAAADFKRSADISPQLEPIRYMLGMAYANLGRFEEALAQYDVAIALNPYDDRVYYAKGMALKLMHRDAEANQQMVQSCKLKNRMACLILSMSNK